MRRRPVAKRARRITKRLASVAEIASCHHGMRNRRRSSSPTQIASSVGSIVVSPCRAGLRSPRLANVRCPDIAPVSPRQKSTYSIPSTSTKCTPAASATKTGKPPGQRRIQFIGTPPMNVAAVCASNSADRGCSAPKRSSSPACAAARRWRSTRRGGTRRRYRPICSTGRDPTVTVDLSRAVHRGRSRWPRASTRSSSWSAPVASLGEGRERGHRASVGVAARPSRRGGIRARPPTRRRSGVRVPGQGEGLVQVRRRRVAHAVSPRAERACQACTSAAMVRIHSAACGVTVATSPRRRASSAACTSAGSISRESAQIPPSHFEHSTPSSR